MFAKASDGMLDPAPLFSLFADLRGRTVLVVGGGAAARRKVGVLLEAGADVSLVAHVPEPALRAWVACGRVRHVADAFDATLVERAWLVIAASGDERIDRAVAAAATARGTFVNVVDDARASSFHVPAKVRRGRLQVAISSAGAAPVVARRLRERLEAELDESLAALTQLFARERARIQRRFPQAGKRRRFFEQLLDGEVPRLWQAGDAVGAQAAFERALATGVPEARRGSVALVGAGPGDSGLLTLKALRALQEADVLLHDRLIGRDVLELARRDAERIDVGKSVGGDHDATQARIHALMLRHSRAGLRVVRLKGGDPLLFGRGGEELQFLRAHEIPHEVIPGITAAVAAAAAAGVPLTDRRHARSVTLLSPRGHTPLDHGALAAPGQTLAIYMGVGELDALSQSLLRHGRDADTPCVLVEHASLPDQRVLQGTLAELRTIARTQNLQAPTLLIVGEVAAPTQGDVITGRGNGGPTRVMASAA